MIWCISFFFSNFFVQYISLLFIGMLVVISVRGFLTNLMKVFLLLSIANFFPLDVAWISYISSVLDNITICFHPLLLGVGQLSCWGKNLQFHWKEANIMCSYMALHRKHRWKVGRLIFCLQSRMIYQRINMLWKNKQSNFLGCM